VTLLAERHHATTANAIVSVGFMPNGVELAKTCSGSCVGFRRIAALAEILGEFRHVNSTPFGFTPAGRQLTAT